jgi:prenyltransferase/squalene oxidase-like repeat protein
MLGKDRRRKNMAVCKSVKTLTRPRAFLAALFFSAAAMGAADDGAVAPAKPLAEVLSARDRRRMEEAVDRALEWMASQQAANGTFPTLPQAQPAITSLCVLAFLSRGHQPGLGPYGAVMEKGIDFVISCQRPDGLFSFEPITKAVHEDDQASHAAVYNHAIAGLMLGEVYGHVTGRRAVEVKRAMEKALQFTRELQTRSKAYEGDQGGWRYLYLRWNHLTADSDLSVTAWQLMFLRSARNAEFNVPQQYIDEALEFVHRCWKEKEGVFYYAIDGTGFGDIRTGRGMVAAGVLSLALAGQHQSPIELAAGDWLLSHPFRGFGERIGIADRFFYSAYYTSQAAAQLGGRYWEGIFPPLAAALMSAQSPDGSWPAEVGHRDMMFGNVYTSALAVLSLTPAFQLLPVYQR